MNANNKTLFSTIYKEKHHIYVIYVDEIEVKNKKLINTIIYLSIELSDDIIL